MNYFNYITLVLISITISQSRVSAACTSQIACENGAQFNDKTCNCECYPSYNGTKCEIHVCGRQDPPNCGLFHKTYCSITTINHYCPLLCGKQCTNTTKVCKNAGKLENGKCVCQPQYDGELCETLKCIPEDPKCSFFTNDSCAKYESFKYACPYLCGLCSATNTSSALCPNVNCQNGGILIISDCKCKCK